VIDAKPWAEKFYSSDAWHTCRDSYLASVGHLCERCADAGKVIAAKIVHHRKHITITNVGDARVTLTWENLEALCQDCHNREHHGAPRVARYVFGENGEVYPPMPQNKFGGAITEN